MIAKGSANVPSPHSAHPGQRHRVHCRGLCQHGGAPPSSTCCWGAAATKSGQVTDAILASGLARGWSTYYWFLEQGRWSWLRVWAALLEVLTMLFRPAVWYAVIDDSVCRPRRRAR